MLYLSHQVMTEKGSVELRDIPSTQQLENSPTHDAKTQRSVSDADNAVTQCVEKEEAAESTGSQPTEPLQHQAAKTEENQLEFVDTKDNKDSTDSQQFDIPEAGQKSAEASTCHVTMEERLNENNSSKDNPQARRNVHLSRSQALHITNENDIALVPSQIVVVSTTDLGSSRAPSREKTGRLRRGKWTAEEEAYVARVIQDFNSGYLDAPAGTTLRTYLSEKLQCDPMRITKKFTGDACIGKRVFHPAVRSPNNASSIDKAQAELVNLEKRWHRRLESQHRESAKKVAATAAAASIGQQDDSHIYSKKNTVVRTATWLDRARSLLEDPSSTNAPSNDGISKSLETQMKEVQRLIHEGPAIQENTAGLGTLSEQSDDLATASSGSDTEPADKRLRTAEDAEALVGFLRTVRAFAASGQET